jgi:hypothetical protein
VVPSLDGVDIALLDGLAKKIIRADAESFCTGITALMVDLPSPPHEIILKASCGGDVLPPQSCPPVGTGYPRQRYNGL